MVLQSFAPLRQGFRRRTDDQLHAQIPKLKAPIPVLAVLANRIARIAWAAGVKRKS